MFLAGLAPRLVAPLQDMVVDSDRPAEITCQFEASPTPSVQWFREGLVIKPSTDFAVSIKAFGVEMFQKPTIKFTNSCYIV